MKFHLLLGVAALTFNTAGVQAADLKNGMALHAEHCVKCHDDSVYKREDRRVVTRAGLEKQVQRCEQSLGLTWFDEQLQDVVGYLNSTYYHFDGDKP